MNKEEIKRREQVALAAIKSVYSAPDQEYGVTMFVEHHLEELEPGEWEKICGSSSPNAQGILNSLVLREHWDNDSIFDFTLPDDVTDYVISVSFDNDGKVIEIGMES